MRDKTNSTYTGTLGTLAIIRGRSLSVASLAKYRRSLYDGTWSTVACFSSIKNATASLWLPPAARCNGRRSCAPAALTSIGSSSGSCSSNCGENEPVREEEVGWVDGVRILVERKARSPHTACFSPHPHPQPHRPPQRVLNIMCVIAWGFVVEGDGCNTANAIKHGGHLPSDHDSIAFAPP